MPSEEFYAVEDVEKSWTIYLDVHASYPNAILIGGWGAWLHSRAARSHDIDLIVDFEDFAHMRDALDLSESTHLGSPKWRGTFDDIHLDVYVPHQSRLGQILRLPVEQLVPYTIEIDGYPTLNKEALLVAKAAARLDRPDTGPGKKDAADMTRMLLDGRTPWDFDLVHRIADCSESKESSGHSLVLRAIAGLADEEERRSRARQLRALTRDVEQVFSVPDIAQNRLATAAAAGRPPVTDTCGAPTKDRTPCEIDISQNGQCSIRAHNEWRQRRRFGGTR